MSYCLTSNNLGINKREGDERETNVGLNFILSGGLGWKTYPKS